MDGLTAYTNSDLRRMFPSGVPLSALLVLQREELSMEAKHLIIDELAKEFNPPPALRTQAIDLYVKNERAKTWRAAMRHAQRVVAETAMSLRPRFMQSVTGWRERFVNKALIQLSTSGKVGQPKED